MLAEGDDAVLVLQWISIVVQEQDAGIREIGILLLLLQWLKIFRFFHLLRLRIPAAAAEALTEPRAAAFGAVAQLSLLGHARRLPLPLLLLAALLLLGVQVLFFEVLHLKFLQPRLGAVLLLLGPPGAELLADVRRSQDTDVGQVAHSNKGGEVQEGHDSFPKLDLIDGANHANEEQPHIRENGEEGGETVHSALLDLSDFTCRDGIDAHCDDNEKVKRRGAHNGGGA
mmetsp:Transcript_98822/g.235584  ORF Transcript_98822/g.235584 Transcript_98822/m.235584 type:complete len:228 (-) Transcript_98822:445-1128(-)